MHVSMGYGKTFKGFSGIRGFVESRVKDIYVVFIHWISVEMGVIILPLAELVFTVDAAPAFAAVI